MADDLGVGPSPARTIGFQLCASADWQALRPGIAGCPKISVRRRDRQASREPAPAAGFGGAGRDVDSGADIFCAHPASFKRRAATDFRTPEASADARGTSLPELLRRE